MQIVRVQKVKLTLNRMTWTETYTAKREIPNPNTPYRERTKENSETARKNPASNNRMENFQYYVADALGGTG